MTVLDCILSLAETIMRFRRALIIVTIAIGVVLFYMCSLSSKKTRSLPDAPNYAPAFPGPMPSNELSCGRLLLTDEGIIHKTNKTWSPSTPCHFLPFNRSCFAECVHSRMRVGSPDLWFIGDSRVRNMFSAVSSLVSDVSIFTWGYTEDYHRNFSHIDNRTEMKLDFYWDPLLEELVVPLLRKVLELPQQERPYMILIGAALWDLRRGRFETVFEGYTKMLRNYSSLMDMIAKKTEVRIIWVVQDPLNEAAVPEDSKDSLTNKYLDAYNNRAAEIFEKTDVLLWRSAREVSVAADSYTNDGRHVNVDVRMRKAALLLNSYCQGLHNRWYIT